MIVDEPTSNSLLSGLGNRDPAAWSRVAIIYAPSIKQWCRRSRLPESDVDDIVQRVLLNVIEGFADYRQQYPQRSFRKWLWKVTQSRLHDVYRERFRHETYDPQVAANYLAHDGLAADDPPADAATINAETRRALEFLRRDCRQSRNWLVFMRVIRGEGTMAGIATDFDMTVENVRQIKRRYLLKLHRVLEWLDDDDECHG